MAVDFTAETMTNWAREELDLGDFQTELLKTGLEFGLDKGLDKVGSKHVPFTDDMTFQRRNGIINRCRTWKAENITLRDYLMQIWMRGILQIRKCPSI